MNRFNPTKNQIWRHFKGNKYLILGMARTDEDSIDDSSKLPDFYAKDVEYPNTLYAVLEINGELILDKKPDALALFPSEYVIYQDLDNPSKVWARELNNFKDPVKVDDFFHQDRFQLVGFKNESASINQSEKRDS